MKLLEELVLPEDVLIVSQEALSADERERIGAGPGDHIILRPGARTPAKLLEEDAAGLLELFRAPRRIVDAVIAHSSARGLDPRRTLDEAFPLLEHFVAVGLLVQRGTADAATISFSLEAGDDFAGFRIIEAIQALEDAEVYRAVTGDDGYVAVKIARNDAGTRFVENERRVLAALDGTVDPGLVSGGTTDGRAFVATAWCEGLPVMVAAESARSGRDTSAVQSLCASVLDAYHHLHSQGVVHGDVHPNNVIVTGTGAAKVLDFGLARVAAGGPDDSVPRGGIPLFLDPELARARLEGRLPNAPAPISEQYSLGVLVYALMTGRPYIELSPLDEEALRQITAAPPLPFTTHGSEEWPEMEQVIGRALAKQRDERWPTVGRFAEAIRQVPPRRRPARRAIPTWERLADPSTIRRAFGGSTPDCWANAGAAGVAYALLRMSLLRRDADLLAAAYVWARNAQRRMPPADAPDALLDELPPGARLDVSLYHRPPGVHYTVALIAHANGDFETYGSAVEAFLAATSVEVRERDLTLGRAGAILGCCGLLTVTPPGSDVASAVAAAGDARVEALWNELRSARPGRAERHLDHLGIAHGWGGILYVTLAWHLLRGTAVPEDVTERLDELAALGEPYGKGGLRWPRLAPPNPPDYWVGWCNGNAGMVHLWNLAAAVYTDDAWVEVAERAVAYAAEPRSGGDLCCGSAGSAYALLALHRTTEDPEHLAQARGLAAHARAAVRPVDALYKGALGVALLEAELDDPGWARMPLFEI